MGSLICHFSTVHRPDDTRVRHKQCGSLVENGFDVVFVAQASPDLPEPEDDVRRIGLPRFNSKLRRLAYQPILLARLLRLRADVYQTHDPELIPLLLVLKLLRKNVILDIHEDLAGMADSRGYIPGWLLRSMRQLVRLLERSAVLWCDEIVVARQNVADRIEREYGRTVCVILNYPLDADFKQEFSIEQYSSRKEGVVYLGAITLDRGLDQLQGLATALNGRFSVGVAGPDNDRYALDARLAAGDLVHWGQIDRNLVPEFLDQFRVGVAILRPLPIYTSEIPTKLYEYMARGLPIVASDFDGNAALLKASGAGLVVDPLDADDVLNKVEKLLGDPKAAHSAGQAGLRHVRAHYSWDSEAVRYVGRIEAIASQ